MPKTKKQLSKKPGAIAVIRLLNDGGLSVVRISQYDTEKYYWFGGPTWAYGGYEVVEYLKLKDWQEIELYYFKKYYPAIASKEIKQSAFWMSPEGNLYYCDPHGHDGLAKCITASIYDSLEGARCLEKQNWIRAYQSGLIISGLSVTPEITEYQAEKISDLKQVGDEDWKDYMSRTLERFHQTEA